jgi:hypothetical protein
MTLTTDYHFECCSATYDTPVADAVANWNARNTTVLFSTHSTHTADRALHIIVKQDPNNPNLGWMQPWVRENSPPYAYSPCNAFSSSCVFDKANVVVNDSTHTGIYATYGERRLTTAHEMGHAIGLGEALSSCGGPTDLDPETIMDGDCNWQIQPWTVCGVNHAYHDPWWGYAGC